MTTQVVIDIASEVITKLQTLASEQQQQVLDFTEFLAQKYTVPQEVPKKQRVLGLHEGMGTMTEDFNDPLSDDFLMGES
jgi:mRNA-degrading endonuclease RelE of RelBE toxin-antitoxin system